MIVRPNTKETEEDLLKQQENFFKSLKKDSPTEKERDDVVKNTPELTFGIIGDVVEKTGQTILESSAANEDGFPSVFKVDPAVSLTRSTKKKSLFSQKLEERNENLKRDNIRVYNDENVYDEEIHEENLKKLELMTPEQILEEKKKLESTLSPDLLNFLKNRGAKHKKMVPVETPVVESKKVDATIVKENILKTINEKWLELDEIEPEKLEWIGDIPDASALEPDKPFSARFDFSGDLQPFKAEVDVRSSLHHHGDEPHRPGYTIQELYQLSRSTVLQQRILALNTLAKIIRKTKMGYYDSCFDGALLKKLAESDFFFLLRFAMDDRSAIAAAVNCLHELFVCRSDEICLDRLRNFPGVDNEPFLFVPVETDKDSGEDELKDHQVIAQDMVRGVLRTDLLVRFSYIISKFDLDPFTLSKIFEVVIRVCRHSPEACQKVLESQFISHVFDNIASTTPDPEAIKLLRIITLSSQDSARFISLKFNFDILLKIIDMDKPAYKLKLECLALWRTFLCHGFMLDKLQSFTPCLIRLLWFYVSKVDITHGRFDFELFAGIVSLLSVTLDLKLSVDVNYTVVLQVCLEKWMTQLTSYSSINFSVAKAIGCALKFFTSKYINQGVEKSDLAFLRKFSLVLTSFLKSNLCRQICDSIKSFSYLINYDQVDRDPKNLPSLCSVYRNGVEYLRLVQDRSPIPLIHPLVEFLLLLANVSHDLAQLPQILVPYLETYVQEILKASETSSWFSRYEIIILISILKVKHKFSDPKCLDLGCKLVPFLRTDDEQVLSVINVLSGYETFSPISEIFRENAKLGFKKVFFHSCDNFPKHWMYELIVAAPHDTLSCLSNILSQCPDLLSRIPPTLRFCHLCLVLLNGENIFDVEIRSNLERCLVDVLNNFVELDLNTVSISEKTFYELYRDLVAEYASSSYGDQLFAKVVTLPLAQKFDVSYRKLMWSEYMHALRVITLPKEVNFVPLEVFINPVETDESLLVLYLNAISKNVLTEARNGFIYNLAVENIRAFLALSEKDEALAKFLRRKISDIRNENLRQKLLN